MNIESPKISHANEPKQQPQPKSQNNSDVKFSDELKELETTEKAVEESEEIKTSDTKTKEQVSVQPEAECSEKGENEKNPTKPEDEHMVGNAINDLTFVVNKLKNPNEKLEEKEYKESFDSNNLQNINNLNQKEDKIILKLKNFKEFDDKSEEGEDLINNDFSIDNKDKLPQMTPNMNFGGDGQPFSSFMNNDSEPHHNEQKLSASAKDLAEEAAILSTMAENVAIANKSMSEEPDVKVVTKNDGIKKVDTKTNIVQETIVKYDTVIMNEADVEVFAELVQNGEANLNNLAPEAAQKSVHVSKTLADMLAKAMEDNKPVRIEFDNGISVIIKISRDGKLSADFLPSTQVAEAYLKENLPLLKQRFDEQNIDYDELNQRERRDQNREQNRKKGQENE